MPPDPDEPREAAGFTARNRWAIAFTLCVYAAAVLALVVMANYLAARHFLRVPVSAQSRDQLSPRTLELLKSITNNVRVTVYFSREDPLYDPVVDVLNEYKLACPRISVSIVDYERDAGNAEKIQAQYRLSPRVDKNLVIFDGNGVTNIVSANLLANYTFQAVPGDNGEPEYAKIPKTFNAELRFDSALMSVMNPRHLNAYFLEGHQEHSPDVTGLLGYSLFASVLEQNNIRSRTLSLLGTNQVPLDCSLLIIAGPRVPLAESELAKISQYLNEGGRLFVLFTYLSHTPTGLEKVLADWNVRVDNDQLSDPDNKVVAESDFATSEFVDHNHPIVSSLIGSRLFVVWPHSIGLLNPTRQNADAPEVTMLVSTGPHGKLLNFEDNRTYGPGSYPFIVAVEKGKVKGVPTQRGLTRIVAAGDSTFLDNQMILSANNHDFANTAVNWLVDQTLLMPGVGSRPVTQFRVLITTAQISSIDMLLLAGVPGATLFLGGLVWLRRRH